MKVTEFCNVLKEAADLYRSQRNDRVADGLLELGKLFEGNDANTVDAVAKMIVAAYKSAVKPDQTTQ